jgi:hypothetical protein
MPRLHNVDIDNTAQDWLEWGKLVKDWCDPTLGLRRPVDVGEFNQLLIARGIGGRARGGNRRAVSIVTYDSSTDDKTIVIPIPHWDMLMNDWEILTERWNQGHKKYPIPRWYGQAFQNDPPKRFFNDLDEIKEMGLRRLGEYVINECM